MATTAVEVSAATRTESITLSFKTADELELYDGIVALADEDERTPSKYTLLFLKKNLK